MGVDKFGRETDVVAHDRGQGALVALEGALGAQHDLETGFGEQRVPEGEVLIHIQHSRNGDDRLLRVALHRFLSSVKEKMVFIGVDVLSLDIVFAFVVEDALALVAGIETAPSGKLIHGHEAMVLAAFTVEELGVVGRHIEQVVKGMCLGDGRIGITDFSDGMQGTAIGTHHLGHIAACHLGVAQQFEGSDHGVVLHRTALYDDVSAQAVVAMEFQHFIQAVAHHGIAQTSGDVLDGGALTHHLLDLGIHKDGAACA